MLFGKKRFKGNFLALSYDASKSATPYCGVSAAASFNTTTLPSRHAPLQSPPPPASREGVRSLLDASRCRHGRCVRRPGHHRRTSVPPILIEIVWFYDLCRDASTSASTRLRLNPPHPSYPSPLELPRRPAQRGHLPAAGAAPTRADWPCQWEMHVTIFPRSDCVWTRPDWRMAIVAGRPRKISAARNRRN